MIVTREQVESLSAEETITLKEYRQILSAISQRVDIVWNFICNLQNRPVYWWAFSNDIQLDTGNGSTGGYFNPLTDNEYIELIGDYKLRYYSDSPKKFSGAYETGFPTELLWDQDWRNTIISTIEQEKKEIADLKAQSDTASKDRRSKRTNILFELKNKLSPEELEFVASDLTQKEKNLLLK